MMRLKEELLWMGEVIRGRKWEVNIQHGVACIVGYLSTLAAWLGGSKSFGEVASSSYWANFFAVAYDTNSYGW